jgi:hypothetical protein
MQHPFRNNRAIVKAEGSGPQFRHVTSCSEFAEWELSLKAET